MIQKPISEKTIVDNVLRWGTGGINIDGCRIGTDDKIMNNNNPTPYSFSGNKSELEYIQNNLGRFPANFIHDGSDEVLEEFEKAGINKSGYNPKAKPKQYKGGTFGGGFVPSNYESGYGDTGTPARFFYCSKPSTKERNMGCDELEESITKITNMNMLGTQTTIDKRKSGETNEAPTYKNNHPTIKSVKLMAYLITLIAPPKAIILDPFTGSGTTGISALLLGHKFIGIELSEEYMKIAETRIKNFEKYRIFLK
jgi:site-specific DNA-methyltransferase (adenine-specific)